MHPRTLKCLARRCERLARARLGYESWFVTVYEASQGWITGADPGWASYTRTGYEEELSSCGEAVERCVEELAFLRARLTTDLRGRCH